MEKHEVVYRKLKEKGHKGWGGEKYEQRMAGLEENIDLLLENIDLKDKRVLELGSGAGDLSIKMHDRGYEVKGIEISETAVEWANEKKGERKIEFAHASVTDHTVFLSEKFDLIMDGNCLHCLFDEDREKFYKNVDRLLDDEGYFYMASVAAKRVGQEAVIGPIPRCFLTAEELAGEAREFGFICTHAWLIEHEKHNHFRGIFHKKNGLK